MAHAREVCGTMVLRQQALEDLSLGLAQIIDCDNRLVYWEVGISQPPTALTHMYWNRAFCQTLMEVLVHPAGQNQEWLYAARLKLSVRCRMDNCRERSLQLNR